MDSLHWDSVVCGHYAYNVGKSLCVEQETSNADHFTVAIVKAETIIGHVPCKFSLCFLTIFQYH